VTCRVLNVRRQGYYEWLAGARSVRAQENELLSKYIEKIHEESRGTYGWPRVHAELTLGLGLAVNHKRVARLMREAGLQGLYRRRRHGYTVRDPVADPHPDLVERRFNVDAPDRLWVTDITEHATEEGKLYCAAVLDAYSRRIVGWSIDDNMRTALVTDALGMAITRRRPDNGSTILHSDHGSQYTSWAFGAASTRCGPARVNGFCRRLLRQLDDGVVLGDDATRTARLEELEDPRRACQRDIRVDRVLVQPQTAPFQHWNAQSGGLRSPPHRPYQDH
jgi:transposase InsO family protein